MSVMIDGTGETLRASAPAEMFTLGRRLVVNAPLRSYDVTQDGNRVLAALAGTAVAEAKAPITVSVNWLAASRR